MLLRHGVGHAVQIQPARTELSVGCSRYAAFLPQVPLRGGLMLQQISYRLCCALFNTQAEARKGGLAQCIGGHQLPSPCSICHPRNCILRLLTRARGAACSWSPTGFRHTGIRPCPSNRTPQTGHSCCHSGSLKPSHGAASALTQQHHCQAWLLGRAAEPASMTGQRGPSCCAGCGDQ